MAGGQFTQKWEHHSKDPAYRKTYKSWNNMNSRCYRKNDENYPNYGARGIIVCDRWRDDYDAFVEDMGIAPKGMTLDRIDVDDNYTPGNCRWATVKEQANNTRRNLRVTHEGETLTLAQWAERLNISETRLRSRLRIGWSFERAIAPDTYAAPHGSDRRYQFYGCRCDLCVTEKKARRRKYYASKKIYDL